MSLLITNYVHNKSLTTTYDSVCNFMNISDVMHISICMCHANWSIGTMIRVMIPSDLRYSISECCYFIMPTVYCHFINICLWVGGVWCSINIYVYTESHKGLYLFVDLIELYEAMVQMRMCMNLIKICDAEKSY